MTDKELRKLSRLELLEILLEETKENERLKAELKTANNTIKNAATLSELIGKMNITLNQAQSFTSQLQNIAEAAASPVSTSCTDGVPEHNYGFSRSPAVSGTTDAVNNTDKKLYVSLLNYYLSNRAALNVLPPDIQSDVRARIRGILDAKKQDS